MLSTAKGSTGTHLVQQFQVQIVACAPLDESHRGDFVVQKEHKHKSLTNVTLPYLRELLLCNMVSTRGEVSNGPMVSIISQYEVVFECFYRDRRGVWLCGTALGRGGVDCRISVRGGRVHEDGMGCGGRGVGLGVWNGTGVA